MQTDRIVQGDCREVLLPAFREKNTLRMEICHNKQEVDDWLAQRHYLGKPPACARLRLVFRTRQGHQIGAMLWAQPTARELDQNRILELSRMAFVDDTEPFIESRALAMARKHIRKYFPKIKLLLSYCSVNRHQGTIYAADNWCPFGFARENNPRGHRKGRIDRDLSRKQRWVRSP